MPKDSEFTEAETWWQKYKIFRCIKEKSLKHEEKLFSDLMASI